MNIRKIPRLLLKFVCLSFVLESAAQAACDQTLSVGADLAKAVASAHNGTTICLNSGNYGAVNLFDINHSGFVTLQSATGTDATMSPSIGNSKYIQFVNVTLHGALVNHCSTHIHFIDTPFIRDDAGLLFTNDGYSCPAGSQDYLVDGANFSNVGQATYSGRLSVVQAEGIVIRNSVFSGISSNSPSDGILLGRGTRNSTIGPGNIFSGIQESLCGTVPCEAMRLAGAGSNNFITGNSFKNGDTFIAARDGRTKLTNNNFDWEGISFPDTLESVLGTVVGVQFKLDGVDLGAEDTTEPYSITWNSATSANGPHALTAVARDAAGNRSTSTVVNVTVTNDTTPAAISGVSASNVTNTTATINWTTNEAADSQVEYGLTTSYGIQTTLDISLVTSHAQNLFGLLPGSTYNFRVKSRDAAGNLAASPNQTFTNLLTPPVPTTGLIGYWQFNEGAGSATVDASGKGNSGTLSNNPAWVTGVSGKALLFSASDDGNDSNDPRVMVGRNFDVSSLPFTLTAWINPSGFKDWRAIFSKRDTDAASNMRFDTGLAQGSGKVYLFTGAGKNNLTFNYTPPLNTWTHIAIVVTASNTKLYVNGALRQTLGPVALGTGASANTVIGGTGEGAGGDNDPFKGTIDEVIIYNRGLSAAEVQQIFAHR